MSTTLPLFWSLSSATRKDRISASIKLVSALQHFQSQHVPNIAPQSSGSSSDEDPEESVKSDGLDVLNSQDVAYSIRRLIRGLASPRESSRLGFAVALTELLSQLNTVTCSQIISLIIENTKPQGSINGQEERDILFAKLFGFTSVIQSGLLVRTELLPASASGAAVSATLSSYQETLSHLLELGHKKSWLRESVWWSLSLAIDTLARSDVSWKEDALDHTITLVAAETWSPEKIVAFIKLQKCRSNYDWQSVASPVFKNADLLSTANFGTLAKLLKESSFDEASNVRVAATPSWKPQLHYVWDAILDELLPAGVNDDIKKPFPEFFRIVVDESLFASTSSPERKYWGFQVFQKALPRVTAGTMPMLFTKNFMRCWINHLSKRDRYLHKIAMQTVTEIQAFVQKNPQLGFSLILQLTGVHGSQQFDKLTKTKTVESILTSMDPAGVRDYIDFLHDQVNSFDGIKKTDYKAINSRRLWIIEQLAGLIRNTAIPRDDECIQTILDWLLVHGMFEIKKMSSKSKLHALQSIPEPAFSDELREAARTRLLSSLADLTSQANTVTKGSKGTKVAVAAADDQLWLSRVFNSIDVLTADSKHVSSLIDQAEHQELFIKARETIENLKKASTGPANGAALLLQYNLLRYYSSEEKAESDEEVIQSCIDGSTRLFLQAKKKKNSSKVPETDEDPAPLDVLVDVIIGHLEQGSASMRTMANHAFALLSESANSSTIDLIVSQLQRRTPEELQASSDDDAEDEEMLENDEGDEEISSEDEEDDDSDDPDAEVDSALRDKIAEVLRLNNADALSEDEDDEDEELMDDDQMMAIDDQLAEVLRSRVNERQSNSATNVQREATHFKNRVLDLVDTYIRKHPTNALVLRFILPLTEVATQSSSDEKQLSEKAQGILKSRLSKAKDVPENIDLEEAGTILTGLHDRAKRTSNANVLDSLSRFSIYVSKVILHHGKAEAVLGNYRGSLVDFITRKNSSLNTSFFSEFFSRFPSTAWQLRGDLTELTSKAVNAYRRCQAFQLLQSLTTRAANLDAHATDLPEFLAAQQQVLLETLNGCCDEKIILNTAQQKDLLKLALTSARLAARHPSAKVRQTWDAGKWTSLSARLPVGHALAAMCKQVAQLSSSSGGAHIGTKRRGEEAEITGEKGQKAKRKKLSQS